MVYHFAVSQIGGVSSKSFAIYLEHRANTLYPFRSYKIAEVRFDFLGKNNNFYIKTVDFHMNTLKIASFSA